MVKKIQINISNKTFYTIVVVVALIALGVVVYAQALPNPGHTAAQIQPPSGCTSGEVLSWTGTAWDCIAQETPKQYVGLTSQSYNGAGVGGYSGGNDKCATEFGAGARMATGADFADSVPSVNGWYNGFSSVIADSNLIRVNDCSGWTSSSGSLYGPRLAGGSTFGFSFCSVTLPIACAQ